MIDFNKLLAVLQRGWCHSVHEWKSVSSTWPTDACGFRFERTQLRANSLEIPWASGRILDVESCNEDGVELYDPGEERFYTEKELRPSDLDVLRLDQASFASWFSRHVGLGNRMPVENPQGLFRLPMQGSDVFLGLACLPKDCIQQIREVRALAKGEPVLVTLCEHSDVSSIQRAAQGMCLLPFRHVVVINETGVPEKCNLADVLQQNGRSISSGKLFPELPACTTWEDIVLEISTLSRFEVENEDMLQDKLRAFVVRNGEKLRSSRPRSVRELHEQFYSGNRVTNLWLMMREYAQAEGSPAQKADKKQMNRDNTNRCNLSKILRSLVGISEPPFKSTRGCPAKFKIRFSDF